MTGFAASPKGSYLLHGQAPAVARIGCVEALRLRHSQSPAKKPLVSAPLLAQAPIEGLEAEAKGFKFATVPAVMINHSFRPHCLSSAPASLQVPQYAGQCATQSKNDTCTVRHWHR